MAKVIHKMTKFKNEDGGWEFFKLCTKWAINTARETYAYRWDGVTCPKCKKCK